MGTGGFQTVCETAALPYGMQPRNRLKISGASALTDEEVIAVMLGSRKILDMDIPSVMGMSYAEMVSAGIPCGSAEKLIAAKEFAQRCWKALKEPESFSNPRDTGEYLLQQMRNLPREEIRVLFLDSKNHLLREETVFTGSIDSCSCDAKHILREALLARASGIILAHNHPSGDPLPSKEDDHTTKILLDAAEVMQIRFLDHLVIGSNRFCSYAEEGRLERLRKGAAA